MATINALVDELEELLSNDEDRRVVIEVPWGKRELVASYRPKGPVQKTPPTQDDSYFIVKIDGNDLGAVLLGSPTLSRAGIGAVLEADLRDRWISAILQVLSVEIDEGRRPILPVNVTYLGGDDLQFTCAARVFERFLAALTGEEPQEVGRIADVRYRLAAVEILPGRDEEDSRRVPHAIARAVLEQLLDSAKRPNSSESPPSWATVQPALWQAFDEVAGSLGTPEATFPWAGLDSTASGERWDVLKLTYSAPP